MIRTERAVVVEGRYDKSRLEGIVDGLILTTNGFNIFRDRDKQALFRRLGRETGLIVLTDSDDAGFKIRKYVEDLTGRENVLHAYIPERPGKERRKPRAGAAGLLGVEGLDTALIESALRDALTQAQPAAAGTGAADAAKPDGAPQTRLITAADLCEDGLNGCAGARARRERFLRMAELPTRLSTNALLALLNRLVGYAGYKVLVRALEQAEESAP